VPDWLPPAAAVVLVALVGNIGGWFLLRSQLNKNRANAAGTLTDSAVKMLQEYRQRQDELEADVRELRAEMGDIRLQVKRLERENAELRLRIVGLERENAELRYGITRLTAQLHAQDIKPVWEPGGDG